MPAAALARPAAPSLGSGAERRVAPRMSVMRDGQAFRADGLAVPVLIVDLSDGGARLRQRGQVGLPADFVLVDPATFLAHRARVVWRQDAELGVQILRSQSLRGVVPGALQAAKSFCERAGR